MRTVTIHGKGMVARLVFSRLMAYYPDAVLKQPKMKWWQFATRYELRIPHLDPAEIVELGKRLGYWEPPIFTIKVY